MRNFKIFISLLVCAAILVVNAKMTDFLYPNNEMRVVVHKIQTTDYDTLIIGNSHGQCGIDPVALEQFGGMHAINAASGNEFVIDAYYLVRLAAQSTDLKTVIYEIDSAYWMLDEAENCELVKVYHEFPPSKLKFRYFQDKILKSDFRTVPFEWYLYRNYLGRIDSLREMKSSDAYKNYSIEPFRSPVQLMQENGFIAIQRFEEDAPKADTSMTWHRENVKEKHLKNFKRLVDFCRENEIQLVCIMTPIPEVTFSKDQPFSADSIAYFTALCESYDVPFHSYLIDGRDGITHDLADYDDYDGHMYFDSAYSFSAVLAIDLPKLIENGKL